MSEFDLIRPFLTIIVICCLFISVMSIVIYSELKTFIKGLDIEIFNIPEEVRHKIHEPPPPHYGSSDPYNDAMNNTLNPDTRIKTT